MTRSNIQLIRELIKSISNEEEELSIMRKSQETFVKEVKTTNYLLSSEDSIIFCSTDKEDDDNNYDELNQAVIYSSQDKLMNDIKKWNLLRKLNNREPVYYCITQLEHVLNNISHLLERMNIENI